MRFYFETVIGTFTRISGSHNLAEVGTKKDSTLTDALVLTLETGIFQNLFDQYRVDSLSHM